MRGESDSQLILRVKKGDISSFEKLVRKYQSRLVSFAGKILRNDSDAEEVVQDTFLKIYKAVDRIDTSKKISTYIYAVCKNTSISRLRKNRIEVSLNDRTDLSVPTDPEDEFLIREKISVFNRLRTDYRKILRLYYFRGLSYREISDRLRTPINSVRTKLRRGKIFLKKAIEYEEK